MANQDTQYKTIYVGTEVNVQYLQNLLTEQDIHFITKNNFESGLRSGFGGGLPGQVQLLVLENEEQKAKEIVEAAFPAEEENE